jgi:ribose 5-phosphate isomerase A
MTTEERLALLATQAAGLVENDMRVGLGSGTTAEAVVHALGERIAQGLRFKGVATSARTARLAESCGIELVALDDVERLDLGIDGADEIDPRLNLVKGRGGALLREKLVAKTCDQFVVVAASEKLVDQLGTRMPLPVEIVPFGWSHTVRRIEDLGIAMKLRTGSDGDSPFRTDEENFVVDCSTGPVLDPASLDLALKTVTGVVDHGIFVQIAHQALTVDPTGVVTVHEPIGDPVT